jgi:hypothetical protein
LPGCEDEGVSARLDNSAALGDRYGAPRPGRRRLLILAVGTVVALFLGWVAWATWFHSTPRIDSSLISFEVVDDNQAVARLGVRRADASVVGTCTLRAFSEDHTTVGELVFRVPEGTAPLRQTITKVVRTERRATSVELLGCLAPGQPRPR